MTPFLSSQWAIAVKWIFKGVEYIFLPDRKRVCFSGSSLKNLRFCLLLTLQFNATNEMYFVVSRRKSQAKTCL